jgi:uncharacterized membrane protein YfcA
VRCPPDEDSLESRVTPGFLGGVRPELNQALRFALGNGRRRVSVRRTCFAPPAGGAGLYAIMHLELWQWIIGAAAGWLIGVSKTGVPGAAMVVVPMLAAAFGGQASVGIMLPMLLFGDCFAVAWYRRHAQWRTLVGLLPWVVAGMAAGAAALWAVGRSTGGKDILSILIGALVLIMLAVHLLRGRLGDRLDPKSPAGVAGTGVAAGFATTVSNAAGPVMTIYLMAHRLDKHQFIGTIAWYFFIINLSKLPVYFGLSAINPARPIITGQSLLFVAMLSPAMLTGVLLGKWVLPRFPQKAFDSTVLALSAAAAVYLIASRLW